MHGFCLAAEKVGLPTSPPYLSVVSPKKGKTKTEKDSAFLAGVSFASGGAGIFNGTDDTFVRLHFIFFFSYFLIFSYVILFLKYLDIWLFALQRSTIPILCIF